MRRGWLLAFVLAASGLASRPAFADASAAPCPPPPGTPWLRVALQGDGLEAGALREGVLRQMRVDLSPHGVVACEAPADGAPLAGVTLTLTRGRALSLELRDDVTSKRLGRELSLVGVPPDALALSVALAAEELLHASWIEAALTPPPPPAPPPVPRPVPPVVKATNDEAIARMPRAFSTQAALVGAVEHATGGQTGAGGDVRLGWGGRLAVGARVGFRAAPDVASTHGTVHARELLAGLAASYALVARGAPWGAELLVRSDLVDVQLAGDASPGGRASSGSALGVLVGGGAGGWVSIGAPWRVVAEATVAAPVRAVTASDAGAVATGVSGVVAGVALGVGAAL